MQALLALGYNERDAKAALKALPAEVGVADGIKQALQGAEPLNSVSGSAPAGSEQVCQCFMPPCMPPPSALTGAWISMFSRLPSAPSTTRVTGTVSPALSCCFRSISITW